MFLGVGACVLRQTGSGELDIIYFDVVHISEVTDERLICVFLRFGKSGLVCDGVKLDCFGGVWAECYCKLC